MNFHYKIIQEMDKYFFKKSLELRDKKNYNGPSQGFLTNVNFLRAFFDKPVSKSASKSHE